MGLIHNNTWTLMVLKSHFICKTIISVTILTKIENVSLYQVIDENERLKASRANWGNWQRFKLEKTMVDFRDDKSENRIYVGNLDLRITEGSLIKMFSPYGKIVSEDFLWHTRGPKRGEPRGYAFIVFSSKEEAILAKEKMHGRMACGRPLVVRLASEKYPVEEEANSSKSVGVGHKSSFSGGGCGQISRSAKIAAIKNKLKTMEEDSHLNLKKQKQTDISKQRKS